MLARYPRATKPSLSLLETGLRAPERRLDLLLPRHQRQAQLHPVHQRAARHRPDPLPLQAHQRILRTHRLARGVHPEANHLHRPRRRCGLPRHSLHGRQGRWGHDCVSSTRTRGRPPLRRRACAKQHTRQEGNGVGFVHPALHTMPERNSLATLLDLYPGVVVHKERIIPPGSVLPSELAMDPRKARLIYLEDSERPASLQQRLEDPPRIGMNTVTGYRECAGQADDADAVPNAERTSCHPVTPAAAARSVFALGGRCGPPAFRRAGAGSRSDRAAPASSTPFDRSAG